MGKFTRLLSAGGALIVGVGMTAVVMAAPQDDTAEVVVTVNEGVVSMEVTAGGTFTNPTYNATADTTSTDGTLIFDVFDPRANTTPAWTVVANVSPFNGASETDFEADIDLALDGITSTGVGGSVTAITPLVLVSNGTSGPGNDVNVVAHNGSAAGPASVSAVYDATVNIPAGTAPDTYTATVTATISGGGL